MGFLNDLQNKDRRSRIKLLWTTAIISAAVIFIGWLAFIPKDYSKQSEKEIGFLGGLKGELQDGIQSEELQNMQQGWESFDEFRDKLEKQTMLSENKTNEDKEQQTKENINNYRLPLEE